MACGSGYEHMGGFGEVEHEDFVGDGAAHGDGEFVVGFLEFAGVEY